MHVCMYARVHVWFHNEALSIYRLKTKEITRDRERIEHSQNKNCQVLLYHSVSLPS
jgi:hypothetical protein